MSRYLTIQKWRLKTASVRMVHLAQSKINSIDDLPHPKSLPIFGTKLHLLASGSGKMLHEYIDKRHKALGPIFYDTLGGNTKLVFISDPSLMKSLFLNLEGKYPNHILPDPWILYEKLYGNKRGLFFMNGEEWLNNRRVMNKHVLREESQWIQRPVQSTVEQFITKWKNKASRGSIVPDLESDLYRLSTDVIISIITGSDTTENTSRHYDSLLNIFSESVKKIFKTTTQLYGLPIEWYHRLNLKPWREFKECVDLSLLLAQKIVTEVMQIDDGNNGLIRKLKDDNIDDTTITRIIADFVIAAGDTTAYTSLWILYQLSKHNSVINELRSGKQQYVTSIIKESMRLFPVAPFLTRILTKESTLGSYSLAEGTPIIASIYTSGRDEQNFSNADKFLPYRWERNDPRKSDLRNHVSSASLPFALGARSCIGKKIAMLQMTELIYQIGTNFDLKLLNESEVKAITSQVLVPDKEIKIEVSLTK